MKAFIVLSTIVSVVLSDLSADEVYELFTTKFDMMESRMHALQSEVRFLRRQVKSCTDDLDAVKELAKSTGQNNGGDSTSMDDIRGDFISFKRVLSNAFMTEKQVLRGALVSVDRRFLEMEGRLKENSSLHLSGRKGKMDRLQAEHNHIQERINILEADVFATAEKQKRHEEHIAGYRTDINQVHADIIGRLDVIQNDVATDGFCQMGESSAPGKVSFDVTFKTVPEVMLFGGVGVVLGGISTDGFEIETSREGRHFRRDKRALRFTPDGDSGSEESGESRFYDRPGVTPSAFSRFLDSILRRTDPPTTVKPTRSYWRYVSRRRTRRPRPTRASLPTFPTRHRWTIPPTRTTWDPLPPLPTQWTRSHEPTRSSRRYHSRFRPTRARLPTFPTTTPVTPPPPTPTQSTRSPESTRSYWRYYHSRIRPTRARFPTFPTTTPLTTPQQTPTRGTRPTEPTLSSWLEYTTGRPRPPIFEPRPRLIQWIACAN